VSEEAAETSERWGRYVDVLKSYGKGRRALESFNGLRAEHTAAMEARPEAVAAKLAASAASKATNTQADEFIDKATDILDDAGDANETIARDLASARTNVASGRAVFVASLVSMLRTHLALLPEDSDAEALAAQGEALVPALRALQPSKAATRTATKADTAELDVLDGRLLEVISKVNSAGRKAFRRLGNKVMVEAFKYHHIVGKPSETAPEAHEEPVASPPVG
jgi:hypothetical protein